MTRLSQMWWTQFHGPAKFLDTFCRGTAQGGCFFLRHTENIPWYTQFQGRVYERLQQEVGHFQLEAAVDLPEGAGPQWFVEHFLPQHVSNFLSTTKLSAFLTQTGGLRGRAVWLRTTSQDQLQSWLEQLSQFASTPEAQETIFILEGSGATSTRRRVKLFDADTAFTAFDTIQLCTIAINETSCQEMLKPYLTHLLSQLCGSDPNLVELLLEQGETLARDPQTATACLGLDAGTIDRHVRRAQITLILPLLEDMRIYLLTQLYEACEAQLPFQETLGRYTNQYKQVFELEVRHLHHFYQNGTLRMTDSQQAVTQAAYDAGNHFRHNMTSMPFDQVENLLLLSNRISTKSASPHRLPSSL